MDRDIEAYNKNCSPAETVICGRLAEIINRSLTDAECKIWHRHPVWFLKGNPIVGYSKIKAGIRLMFWSGADFEEDALSPGTGKFKDASTIYTTADQINSTDLERWLAMSRVIQWDYRNIYKRKGKLERIR